MDALSALGGANAAAGTANTSPSLGQQDFMRLLIAQFQAQNPLEPLGNTEFIGQLAQFSVVSGVQQLDSSFKGFAEQLAGDQVLQGSSLLGRPVQRQSDQMRFDGQQPPAFAVDVPPGTERIEFDILNASGARVAQLVQAAPPAGELRRAWDGLLPDGTVAPAGAYTLQARAVSGAASQNLQVRTEAVVTAVMPSADGLRVALDDGTTASLSQLTQIRATR